MSIAAPCAATILDAWDRASGQPAWARPLTLLAAAGDVAGGGRPAPLVELPIGVRDDRLMALRIALFGPRAVAVVGCPACGAVAEVQLAFDELRSSAGSGPAGGSIAVGSYVVEFRPPTTADLAAAAAEAADAGAVLLQRCVTVVAGPIGESYVNGELPVEVVEAIGEAMAAADPGADVVLDLRCPACEQRWSAPVDIASFLWEEIDAWATATLGEVDALARTYGWAEPEILALSPARRHRYLELAAR